MAKRPKSQAKKIGGPFLAAAVFCDNVLEEKPAEGKTGGVVSAIRIFDTVTVHLPAVLPPGAIPGVRVEVLLIFRAGDASGKYPLRLVLNSPDGKRSTASETEIRFPGKIPNHGANVRVHLTFDVRVEGVYWLDVTLSGRQVTRMPLSLLIDRKAAKPPPKAEK